MSDDSNTNSTKRITQKITRREFIKTSSVAIVGSQVLVCPVVTLAKASYNFAFWRAYDLRTAQVFAQAVVNVGDFSEVDTAQVFAQVVSNVGGDSEVDTTQVFVQVVSRA